MILKAFSLTDKVAAIVRIFPTNFVIGHVRNYNW